MPAIVPTAKELLDLAKATFIANTTTKHAMIPGDPILAILEASVASDMILVSAAQSVAALTRAHTSKGIDLDSFLGEDFDFPRSLGSYASGFVEITININVNAFIAVGLQIASNQLGVIYEVIVDEGNPYYSDVNPNARGYYYSAGTASPKQMIAVQAINLGSSSNVAEGALSVILNRPLDLLGAVNLSRIENGSDQEKDEAYLSRWRSFILGKQTENDTTTGNVDTIAAAIQAVLPAGSFVFLANRKTKSTALVISSETIYEPNTFVIVAENGSGTLTPGEVGDIQDSVALKVGFPVGFDVRAPTIGGVDTELDIIFKDTFAATMPACLNAIRGVVTSYINGLRIAETVYFSEVIRLVMKLKFSFPGLIAVSRIVIAGREAEDFSPGNTQIVRVNTISLRTFASAN